MRRWKKKGGDDMKKRLYYVIANIFHCIRFYRAFEYFWCKAEAIAEAEYDQDVIDFYENGKGYYGK